MIQKRKKINSSKVNLIISAVFHSILIGVILYFAARGGLLGKKLQTLAVHMEKEKKPEPPKEKPPEPKVEQPKQEAKAAVPQPKTETAATPPPTATAPVVAPAAVVLPDMGFSDGAIAVQSVSSPNDIYKTLVEHTLHSYWKRPEDMADDKYVAQVELSIDKDGSVRDSQWISGSGDARWDQTVKDAVAQLTAISRPPPKGFPDKFTVRFDVESDPVDTIQFGIR